MNRITRYIVSLLLLVFTSFNLHAQTFNEQFHAQMSKGDTTAQLKTLNTWRKTAPNDPEMYIGWFNYYVSKSRKEVVHLDNGPAPEGGLQVKDSTGKKVASMYSDIYYDAKLANKALLYIDTAVERFPDRLDIRFGRIYLLGKLGRYDAYADGIVKTFDYAQQIGMKWKWSAGKPLDDPLKTMLASEQDYVVELFNAGNSNMKYIRQVAEAALKYYPDNVPNLSNLGIACMLGKQYDDALKPLLHANQLSPEDHIVLNNIAYCYELKGDKPNAIKYYTLMQQYGPEEAKAKAKAKIAALQK